MYDVLLSHSLRCKYTCLASDLIGNFILILHESDIDIQSQTATVFGHRKQAATELSSIPDCSSVIMVNTQKCNCSRSSGFHYHLDGMICL